MAEQTIEDLERQREHAASLAELRRQRAEIAGRLAKIDEKIGALDEASFRERLGSVPISAMSTREKSEVVARIGSDGFEALVTGRR